MRALLILSCLFLSWLSFAQQESYRFSNINQDDGLPNNIIHSIYQDHFGYMWFGTENGAARYDGYEIKTYDFNPSKTENPNNKYINSILQDSKGVYWFVTNDGIIRYDIESDSLMYIKDEIYGRDINEKQPFYCIKEANDGKFWFGAKNGIVIYDPLKNTWTKFLSDSDEKQEYIPAKINDILFDNEGNAWLASDNSFLYYFNEDKGLLRKQRLKNIDPKYPDIQVTRLVKLILIEDTLWIGTSDGIAKYNTNSHLFQYFYFNKSGKKIKRLNGQDMAYFNNRLYYTSEHGLIVFNIYSEDYISLHSSDLKMNTLSTDILRSVFIDHYNMLWVGSLQSGVDKADLNPKRFYSFIPQRFENNPAAKNIYAIYQDSKGTIWTGSHNGVINRISETNSVQFKIFPNDKVVGNEVIINSIVEDSKENLWVGSMRLWMAHLDKKTNKSFGIRRVETKPKGLGLYSMREMLIDNKDRLWITSVDKGLDMVNLQKYNFNPAEIKFIHFQDFYTSEGVIPSHTLQCIEIQHDSILWLGSRDEGLIRFNYQNSDVVHFNFDTIALPGVMNNKINDLYLSDKESDILWIGTDYGLIKFNTRTFIGDAFEAKNTLSSDLVKGILEHSNGDLWVSTSDGLNRINYKTREVNYFTVSEGLPSTEFNQRACFKNPETEEMFFAGTNGFVRFHPDEIHIDTNYLKPRITGIYFFGKRCNTGEELNGQVILPKPIEYLDGLTLKHFNNDIDIEFSALNFKNIKKVQYKYKLENFDRDWKLLSNGERRANYTNLNPGNYVFKVKAANPDGIWADTTTEFYVKIIPPFYKTTAFIIFIIIVIILLTILAYYIHTRNLIRKKNALENIVEKRTSELITANALLEEKRNEVLQQNDELESQRDELHQTNEKLIVTTEEIKRKNIELDKYKRHLEQLVIERTQELEKALKKAEESSNLKTAFLSNMSHEFRTPMNAIIGFSNLLDEKDFNSEDRKLFISRIQTNGDLLLQMINTILELAKIQTDQIELFKSDIILSDFLTEIYESFKERNSNSEIIFDMHIDPQIKGKGFYTDPYRLKQIVENVIDNAFKYTSKGSIMVSCSLEDEKVIIAISDTGIGIPEDYNEGIYRQFVKYDSPNKLFRGSGLGLTISKGLCDLMGCGLWHTSEVDKGTTFFISSKKSNLKSDDPMHQIVPSDYDIPNLENKTVLIAEDEEVNYKLLEIYLLKTKATIIYAKDGVEAIKLYDSESPDLILLDIKMPNKDGIEVIKYIRSKDTETPVIAETAFAQAEEENRIMQHGFNYYVRKPIMREELYNSINSVMHGSK